MGGIKLWVKRMAKKFRRAWKWYIQGYYHCKHCPYCWSEYSYEGDGDCGCYIRGELWDTCRLIPPIRFLIGWPRKKKAEYYASHEYDGYGEWYEGLIAQEEAYAESVKILLGKVELYRRDADGKLIPMCKEELFDRSWYGCSAWEARDHYESKAHPIVHIPLKQQWKELLWKTWNRFADHFRPYFSK